MAYISFQPKDHFKTKLFSGTGSSNAQTGVGFQPDLVWIKNRGSSGSNMWHDVIRAATYVLSSDATTVNTAYANGLTSFDSDGFTLGDWGGVNSNGNTFVSWNWKAGGAGSANTDGALSSTVSVNTTAGISITKYTGGGAASTVGHGLGVAPKVVLIKDMTSANDWRMYHESLGNQSQVSLSQNSAADSGNTAMWNSTSPTSTVFSIGTHGNVSTNSSNYMAYCFAEKKGFSKFGSYTGNGDADGSFIYTGFKPAMVIIKLYSTGSENWRIFDNKRIGYNPNNYKLYPSLNNTEGTSDLIDLYSNGFKPRTTSIESNGSGNGYIYMAFGQSLVGSNNVPCTAR